MKKRNVLKASAKSVLCFTPSGSSMYVRSRPSQASRYCGDNAHQHPGRARALTPPLGDETGRPRVPRISLHRRVRHGGQLLFVSFASFCWSGTMSPSNGRTQAIPRRHGRLSPSLARRVSPPPSGPTSASPRLPGSGSLLHPTAALPGKQGCTGAASLALLTDGLGWTHKGLGECPAYCCHPDVIVRIRHYVRARYSKLPPKWKQSFHASKSLPRGSSLTFRPVGSLRGWPKRMCHQHWLESLL